MKYDFLVVGAGFAGAVCAERLACSGKKVLVIDKRAHIGGNASDYKDESGILIHPYGPHIFHTNSKRIFEYLSKFTNWRFYEHRVLAEVDGVKYPIPINKKTINSLYGLDLDGAGVEKYLDGVREEKSQIRTSEDVVLNSVGRDLCEKFFRGYTKKQWGLDLSQLSAGVAARIPTRTNDDDRYFSDVYQFMPSEGYSAMFDKMLDNELITVRTSVSLDDVRESIEWGHMIYTGQIDAFFDFCLGHLPYRSLRFEHEHIPSCDFIQEVGTVNYPNDHEYTRITEFKHLTGQAHTGTSIVREYPMASGDPYYPVPREANEALYRKYKAMAEEAKGVTFVGRLAQYKYYNMDQVVGAALACVEGLVND